jgi:hypothetical protein
MSDCQTKLDDIKKNCNDLYKSSFQDFKPEWGTCTYSGKTPYVLNDPDSDQMYSGSTRCYRGQIIDTQNGPELCPGKTGVISGANFNCTFVSDSEKSFSTFIIVSIVIAVLLFLVYYFYIRNRK